MPLRALFSPPLRPILLLIGLLLSRVLSSQAQNVGLNLQRASLTGVAPYYLQVKPIELRAASVLSPPTQAALGHYAAAQAQAATAARNLDAAQQNLAVAELKANVAATWQAAAQLNLRTAQARTATAQGLPPTLANATKVLPLLRQEKLLAAQASAATRQAGEATARQLAAEELLLTAREQMTKATADTLRTGQFARGMTLTDRSSRKLYRRLKHYNDNSVQLPNKAGQLPDVLLKLPALELPVDLDDDTPYEVAQRVLRNLRRAARATPATRLAVRMSPEWRPLLLPQRNLLRRKFTTERRRARRMFLSNVQAELEKQFDEAQQTQAAASGQRTLTGQTAATPPTTAASATANPSVLYQREVLFTTLTQSQAERRILRLRLTEVNQAGAERYQVCVSYTSGGNDRGTFVSRQNLAQAASCAAEPNTVSATLGIANLERTLFVEKILQALRPANLIRTDSLPTKYQAVQAAQADLVQKSQTERQTINEIMTQHAVLAKYANSLLVDTDNRTALLHQSDSVNVLLKQAVERQAEQAAATKAALDVIKNQLKDTTLSATEAVKKQVVLSLGEGEASTTTLREALTDLYLDYVRQQTLLLAAPMAGVLDLLPAGHVYYPNVTHHHGTFTPDSVELEVEDGAVLGLKATGRLQENGQKVCFESRSPIGISSDRDLHTDWSRQRLWLQYPLLGHGPVHAAYVRLTDLVRYYPALAPEAGDRSPANGVYVVHLGDPLTRRTFTKIATQKILQGRLYTDLAGVRGDNPNGLVQLEVNRKFAFGSQWSKFSPDYQLQAFGYFTPFVALNKLEQQNRYLPLVRTAQRGTYLVHAIDLLRYTNLRVGGDYNLFGLRLPRFKSDVAFDFGFALHRVDIRDSVRRATGPYRQLDSTLNVASYGFSLKVRVRPDSRYGVTARLGYFRYTLLNDRDPALFIRQVPNPDDTPSMAGKHTVLARYWYEGIIQYELTGRLKIAEHTEYFVRPQFSHSFYHSYRTYFQIQTGFQFDLFGPRREAPPGIGLPTGIVTRKSM